MRAITVSAYGSRPSVTELPTPQAGPGQVLIAIQVAGMNPMDAQIANGAWQDVMPARYVRMGRARPGSRPGMRSSGSC